MSDQAERTNEAKITAEMIAAAEQLIGLSFTDREREQMLAVLNTRLEQYETLRQTPIHNEDGLPLIFQPQAAAPATAEVPRGSPMSAQEPVTRPDNLEDAAFFPVTRLAELLRTRQVTSAN